MRGTWWLTEDHKNGTLVRVKKGVVAVRDFVKKKTVLVKAGQSYFAASKVVKAKTVKQGAKTVKKTTKHK